MEKQELGPEAEEQSEKEIEAEGEAAESAPEAVIPLLEDPNTLSSYLRQINRFPMLDNEEEYELAQRWVDHGDNHAARKIVQSHLRLVAKIAGGYKGYGLPFHDLIAEGNLGILQALRKFDPKKGFRFSTYAMWWIRASMKDYIMKGWSLIKIGTTAAQKKLFFGLRGAKKKLGIPDDVGLTQETAIQIARQLDVHEDEVMEMDLRLSGSDYSLNAFVGDEHDSEWQDWIHDEEMNQETKLLEKDEMTKRQDLLNEAFHCLNERESEIFRARRLHEPPKTLEDVSVKHNISRERVRQIEMKAFEKLQKHVRDLVHIKTKEPQLRPIFAFQVLFLTSMLGAGE